MSRILGRIIVSSLALRCVLFIGVAVWAQLAGSAWAGVIHRVKADAAGAKNGQSWADAYTDLQSALAAAEWGDEIWVAQGTYKPTTGTLRTVSFVLKEGVGLYGGFSGAETKLEQRDWEANATILSGDIGTTASATNSYTVVIGADLAVLDGFTITGGNANGSGIFNQGGGMYNKDCSPTVTNCTLSGNAAGNIGYTAGYGGGMYNENSSPTLTNCMFRWNWVWGIGAGMYNENSSPKMTSCRFLGNWIEGGGAGVGVYNNGSSPTVTNCTFRGNSAPYGNGGGMYNSDSSPTVTDCTFSDNEVGGGPGHAGDISSGSGGGMFNSGGSPTVTNCAFSGNTTNGIWGGGGGMYNNNYTSPTVTNCTFSGNTTAGSGGGMNSSNSSPTVTNCTFSGNAADNYGSGGGMSNSISSTTVTDCTFSNNTANSGGGMDNYDGSPIVTNCTFSGNTVDSHGGGMQNYESSPIVTNCTFSGNAAWIGGGGMYSENSSPAVNNSMFSGNTVGYGSGGGMDNSGGSPAVTNCTFSGNTASLGGGGMSNSISSPTVTNSIFWDNTAPSGAEVYKGSGTPTFSHCDIKGSGGSGALWNPALGADGGGNIAADPRFVAPATPAGPDGLWRTGDDGLRLQSDSPCIGAADPTIAPKTDILGLQRKIVPDIGAYEYYPIVPASADPAWLLFR